ncbi:putative 3'(2'),5'-bisphosphate nucleotidase, mitochondrial isoform X3 [Primulina eburnea]|uniref:putative 3'(2'),5'-bisphosphate nucleotidase, mitochondrial isoform X3 n=1 Tax=Primulina eburnea TaxID=1245227 RepID=UPI003C6C6AE2
MNVLQYSAASRFSATHPRRIFRRRLRQGAFTARSSIRLPFTEEKAEYYDHLRAAADVVERACRLCVDVQKSLFSSDKRILEKMDQTPVTIADFGVQALVSLEMGRLFPSIPLVAEEDSAFLRENNLVGPIVEVVSGKSTLDEKELTPGDILKSIDRGGKGSYPFGPEQATYWILDPIDGTRGFVKGGEALYVVGLALVVNGEIVLGVMGCPNWEDEQLDRFSSEVLGDKNPMSRSGIIMISHVGCGTWRKRFRDSQSCYTNMDDNWTRCFVDRFHQVHEARFCISDSQQWESYPLSAKFTATNNADCVGENQIFLLPTCCGRFILIPRRYLCKYLMVASGRASVFIIRARTRREIMVWDHAVGVICIHEAGGKKHLWMVKLQSLHVNRLSSNPSFESQLLQITQHKLNGLNFREMFHSVILVIKGRGKIGYLTCVVKAPSETDSKFWEAENSIVTA